MLSNIHDDYFKNVNVTSGVLTSFPLIWPGDLVFDPLSNDLETIKTNIFSKIHDDCLKNVTSRMLTVFSFDLTW